MCSVQEPLSLFKGLQMGIFGFSQRETGAKSVAMVTMVGVICDAFCDVYFWCQV